MKRKVPATRREALLILGATGAALVGCGGGESGPGGSGTAGNGTGGNGSSGKGGAPSGTGGAKGGTGGSSTGGTTSGSGGANAGRGGSGTGGGTSGTGGSSDAGGSSGGDAGGGGSAGTGPVNCTSKEETTVGPFPNIDALERRDVRGNTTGNTTPKQGAQLTLRMRVYDLDNSCKPIPGAVVDIWQCDAVGDYASYSTFSTAGQDFLRGYQKTDAQGVAEFLTIFPGSYSGRAIHIHFSIQGQARNLRPNAHGDSLAEIFVAQVYFDQEDIDEIFDAFEIYQEGAPLTTNNADGIFRSSGGKDLIVTMSKNGAGYIGQVDIGIRRSAIGL